MHSNADIGLIGLGVMGRNLALNFADHGFSVSGYDLDLSKVEALNREASGASVQGFDSLEDMVASLGTPRAVLMLVPAGRPVDEVIEQTLKHLDMGDLIIDAGNSHYTDTNRRSNQLSQNGISFIGVGVSGGEEGARHGPSMMPGGSSEAYDRIKPLFEAAAAHVDNQPCVTYLGRGSAGHYVKTVHNGIEYAIMQLLAETYDIMKRGLGIDNDRLHEVYEQWNQAETASYLVEITADIFSQPEEGSSKRIIDAILDQAKQKGTGKWTCQDAMDLQVPVPTIDAAVMMRHLSACEKQRKAGEKWFGQPSTISSDNTDLFVQNLRDAFYVCTIVSYAQGMALLREASKNYDYGISLSDVARIWRGGCIIRAKVLEDILVAYHEEPDLENMIFAPGLKEILTRNMSKVGKICQSAIEAGIAMPAFMASLAYFNAVRSGWLPANLIQAQRDYFGSHTYERTDRTGTFHTDWSKR